MSDRLQTIPPAKQQEIAAALNRLSVRARCPACRRKTVQVSGFYSYLPLTLGADPASTQAVIPCAIVACQTCGNLQLHTLHALGVEP